MSSEWQGVIAILDFNVIEEEPCTSKSHKCKSQAISHLGIGQIRVTAAWYCSGLAFLPGNDIPSGIPRRNMQETKCRERYRAVFVSTKLRALSTNK